MPGPRIFKLDEIGELLPDVRIVFAELGEIRARIKALKLKIGALEMIWGETVHGQDNPDHAEFEHHVEQMRTLQGSFEAVTKRLAEMGGQLKGLEPPLVDFYGVREGILVCWCWTLGEDSVTHWHHVDEGFAARKPL